MISGAALTSNWEQAVPTYRAITPFVAFDGFTERGDFNYVPPERLKVLDGLTYTAENIVEYMDAPLSSVVVGWSGIRLFIDEETGLLTAESHIESTRDLSETEIADLKADYDGHMSDGIGENFLSEIQSTRDLGFKLAVYWLYEESKGSQLRAVE